MPLKIRTRTRPQAAVPPAKQIRLDTSAIKVTQGSRSFYLLKAKASEIWDLVQINRREEGTTEGYQRLISLARVRSISRYIMSDRAIPGPLVVSFDDAEFDEASGMLRVYGEGQPGWIIDGQHRAAGAHTASGEGTDVDLPVVAFLNAPVQDQIELFITINREAKGVPASLYLDLLRDLPRQKTEREILDEKITDIAHRLNQDETSHFLGGLYLPEQRE